MKKRILACCFFPAFDAPLSGGEQKLLRFYQALSDYYDIDLVTWTYPTRSEKLMHSAGFTEHRIAQDDSWGELAAQLSHAGYRGEFSALMTALKGRLAQSAYRDTLGSLWDQADIIIHDFPYTLCSEPFAQDRSKLRLYNSHNFEAALTRSVFQGPSDDLHDLIEALEGDLVAQADLIFATSRLEAEGMGLRYGVPAEKFEVMPLGFDPRDLSAPIVDEKPFALFIGSQHAPNIAAAQEVVALAQRLPELDFVIAGNVCSSLSAVGDNVHLLGRISDDLRRSLFARATVFLNPMQSGAGMNVKLCEALGAGLPVVTTPLGARGFETEALSIKIGQGIDQTEELTREILAQPLSERLSQRLYIQKAARQLYGWDHLAAKAAAAIERAFAQREQPVNLPQVQLYVNDYPLGEGLAGGQKRMLELIRATPSDDLKVLLTLCDGGDVTLRQHAEGFLEINLPKTKAHRDFDQLLASQSPISIEDFSSAIHVLENALFMRWFTALSARAASITFEHCYLAPLLERLAADLPAKLIYSAHNVESDLKRDLLRNSCHSHGPALADMALQLEGSLAQRADHIIVVSQEDGERLQKIYAPKAPISVILNGTNIGLAPARADQKGPLRLIFIGSAHPPNIAGLRAFLTQSLPLLGDVRLEVIGSVCHAIGPEEISDKVALLGMLSDHDKAEALARADIAINPVTSGGGTSLKIGDYMASALPIVSTAMGVRGFDLADGQQVVLADLGQNFADAINKLAQSQELRRSIGDGGYAYAKSQLDWQGLGLKAAQILAKGAAEPWARPKAVLVIVEDQEGLGGRLDEAKLLSELKKLSQNQTVDLVLISDYPPSFALQTTASLRLLRSFGAAPEPQPSGYHEPIAKGARDWLSTQAAGYDKIVLAGRHVRAAAWLQHEAIAFDYL